MPSNLALEAFATCPDGAEHNLLLRGYLEDLKDAFRDRTTAWERDSYLSEVGSHLVQAIQHRMERGETELEATRNALAKFGSVTQNAEEFVTSWFESEGATPLTRRFGRANLVAYGLFQMAELVCLVILQVNVFLPNEAGYRLPFSPAEVRSIWPEPLPFPDFSPRFCLLLGTPIALPIVAGFLVGKMVPSRAHAATYQGMLPLILCSFAVGALLLPATEGLLFALFQIAFWLPVGCLTAFLSSKSSRGCRRRDYDSSRAAFQRPGVHHDHQC